ncbi:hypothetical protein TNCV_936841 [Trichonephila clavipes]|nr:hypothetical protein TNCV_936841 [Trichonephila clavipes]
MQANVKIEYTVHRGRSEHCVQHVVLHYFVGRGLLVDLEGPYAYIECKQETSGLLQASRHVYSHQNPAHRDKTRPKRQHCTTPLSSFVVRCSKVAVHLYAAVSREVEIMVAVLTLHATPNFVAPYERVLGVLQICIFPD